jgi:hypothetical protein
LKNEHKKLLKKGSIKNYLIKDKKIHKTKKIAKLYVYCYVCNVIHSHNTFSNKNQKEEFFKNNYVNLTPIYGKQDKRDTCCCIKKIDNLGLSEYEILKL